MILPELQLPSPVQKVNFPLLEKTGVDLYVKREDLIHPVISGNKWRKLKYNLEYILNEQKEVAVTFGGAFSNHIYAFAGACNIYDIKGVAFIRGEVDDLNNPTLQYARKMGILLESLSRSEYRRKDNSEFLSTLGRMYNNSHIIPEGGSNDLGFLGCKEIGSEEDLSNYTHVCIAAGTGCTAAGIISSGCQKIEVYPALKGDFMEGEIRKWIGAKSEFDLIRNYHFDGYARTSNSLISFINDFYQTTSIPLEPIYTGKMFYGIFDRIRNGVYKKGDRLLAIHTGGLQGIAGYNYMNPSIPIRT